SCLPRGKAWSESRIDIASQADVLAYRLKDSLLPDRYLTTLAQWCTHCGWSGGCGVDGCIILR
ncbi:MAG: hypothetical protein M3Q00_09475, partial [Pseudomonadota bacterium]|nr:hypothetical protein [Pseudomonadota bacterium]